jgi:hypothetical protein
MNLELLENNSEREVEDLVSLKYMLPDINLFPWWRKRRLSQMAIQEMQAAETHPSSEPTNSAPPSPAPNLPSQGENILISNKSPHRPQTLSKMI